RRCRARGHQRGAASHLRDHRRWPARLLGLQPVRTGGRRFDAEPPAATGSSQGSSVPYREVGRPVRALRTRRGAARRPGRSLSIARSSQESIMRLTTAFAAVLLAVLPATMANAQDADTRPGIAVFPFTNGGSFGPGSEDLAPLEVGIQQML